MAEHGSTRLQSQHSGDRGKETTVVSLGQLRLCSKILSPKEKYLGISFRNNFRNLQTFLILATDYNKQE